jgi:hypothetical protein
MEGTFEDGGSKMSKASSITTRRHNTEDFAVNE